MRGRQKNKSSSAQMIIPVLFLCAIALVFQMRWVDENKDKFIDPNMVRLVRQLNPMVDIKILCPHCQGTGEIQPGPGSGTNQVPCPLSFGMGFKEIRINPGIQAVCHACMGMGATMRGEPLTFQPCANCQSTGVLDMENPFRLMTGPVRTYIFECHHCNTRGQVYDSALDLNIQCPVCHGRGKRQTRAMHGVDQSCPNCAGMGRWVDPETEVTELCPRCKGQGLVTQLSEEN